MASLESIFGGPFRPESHTINPPPLLPPEAQLRVAMSDSGIPPPDDIILDGRIRRFPTNGKPSDTSGWYIGYESYNGSPAAGAFGDWRTGMEQTWRADIGRKMNHIEEMAHQRRMAEIKATRAKEDDDRRATAAERAREMWEAAGPAGDDHPYIARKGITNPGCWRVAPDGRLMSQVLDDQGHIAGLQFIDHEGIKKFLSGTKAGGGYTWIGGDLRAAGRAYLCEGLATAASIFEATGAPVVAAYSAGNLPAVATMLRAQLGPTFDLRICADNDQSGTGQREATKAAEATGARLIIPPTEGDANDYAQSGGDLLALLEPKTTDHTTEAGYLEDADTFASQPAPLKWHIKRWLQARALFMIHGPSGGGKTFALLDMLCRVAAGLQTWGDGCIVKRAPVVYLAGEGHHGLRGRIAGWKIANGCKTFGGYLHVSRSGTDLNTPQGYQLVRNAILALPHKPAIIAVDTLHRFLQGDENSAQDAKTMLDACAALMDEFDCSVGLVHHTGVSEEAQHRARGSSAWRGALDIEISVIPGKDGQPLQLVQRKAKDSEQAKPVFMQLVSQPLGWLDDDGEEVTTAVATYCETAELDSITSKETKGTKAKRESFENAIIKYGALENNQPSGDIYITAQALVDYWRELEFENDSTRRSNLNKTKRSMLEVGYAAERDGRYYITNEAAFPTLRALINQPE